MGKFNLAFVCVLVNNPLTMNSLTNLTPRQLRQAANIQEKIQDLQKELAVVLGGETPVPFDTNPTRGKRRMSAAGRAAIAAAARARWAKIKGTAPKRKLSAQGLANIRAGVARRMAAKGKASAAKAAEKPKRKMSPAWRAALERAWAARRAKGRAAR